MAAPDPAVTRIITHMNNDHHDSLVRFLEHYARTPSYTARTANLISFSLIQMTIATHTLFGKSYSTIPLDPPLKSLSEARERLVLMDKECLTKLHRDPVTIQSYRFPRGADFVTAAVCLVLMVVFAYRPWLDPGRANAGPYAVLAERYPGVFAKMYSWQPKLWYPLVGAHILEGIHFQFTRLAKHSVPVGSGVWWRWTVNKFIEGFPVHRRFDGMVKSAKAKQQKHK